MTAFGTRAGAYTRQPMYALSAGGGREPVRMADRESPSVSVCIPTYKRTILLRRAVASVFAQTYKDWELLISDDEEPPGETWDYLLELPKQDPRVRVMRNSGAHGQVENTNSTFRYARGTWLKPLHDDDVLRPECLETLLLATRQCPSVVMVSSLFERYSRGGHVRNWRRRGRAPVELIRQRYIHLGMYLQDCNVGLPSQVMVHRKAIEQGALFENVPGIVSGVDTAWNIAVLRHGITSNDVQRGPERPWRCGESNPGPSTSW